MFWFYHLTLNNLQKNKMSLRIKIDKLRQIVAYYSEFSEEVSINVDSNSNLMYIFAALGGSVNIWAIIPLSASVFY
ncbi:hypothetical protein DEM28_29535, partial [Enterobacter mori]